MFKPNNLALIITSLLGATTAYAVTLSAPTEPVVGFKPSYQNTDGTGSVTGEVTLGSTLSVDPEKLQFFDQDGDVHDIAAVKYSWKVDGTELSNGRTVTIPLDATLVGKAIEVAVTPVSKTGDPLSGDPLVLTDLTKAGATGGNGNGKIGINGNAKPIVKDLKLAGTLKQGEELTATYTFNANGGDVTDSSTYAWGKVGSTVANVGNAVINTSGKVPAYLIKPTDAGEVLELSLRAANAAAMIGNTITVDTAGTVPYIEADPVNVDITFNSSATIVLNGVDGVRPVAQVDQLSATIQPADGASPDVADYTFRWLSDDVEVKAATKGANTFTPSAGDQGKAITVEVAPAPAP